ncbi:MAG: HlyD family efflux transporter periplasmic adaptor subunit [Bacteroidia bacterium]
MKQLIPAILALVIFTSCSSDYKKEKPQKRSITEVVYASGNLYPESEYKLISNVPGYLTETFVDEGDTIFKGQELFLINSENRNSESNASSLALKIAIQNASADSPILAQLRQRLKANELKAKNDSLNLERYKKLAASGSISESDLERVATQAESSMRERNALEEQIKSQQRAQEIELANARNRFNQASNNMDDGLSRSTLDGMVYQVFKEKGDYVNISEPIALIGDIKEPIARLSIDESDFELIQLGQEVQIALDAYPGKLFPAKISKIYPILNKAEQSFKVDARFIEAPASGVYGLNLEANIIIRKAKEVVSIPRAALMINDSVRVIREGKELKVKVEIGVSDLVHVEVLSGIKEDDELILAN